MMPDVTSPLEMILTAIVLGFWILFPVAMFISVSHVDKNTDQIIRLQHLRHRPEEDEVKIPVKKVKRRTRWRPHMPLAFRRWLHH